MEGVPHLKMPRVRQDKVRADAFGEILVHVKAPHKGGRYGGEHHRQGQGEHRHHGLALAAAQVGSGHGKGRHPSAASLCLLLALAALRVPYRLNGGDLRRQPAWLGAGQQHGEQGKQGRAHKDQGMHGHGTHYAVQPLDHHGRQQTAHHPAQHKPDGDADTAQKQRLLPQQSFDLPPGGPDGLQQAIESDVVGHGDLEDIIDNQVSGEHNQQQHRRQRRQRGRVHVLGHLGSGVAPVHAGIHIIVLLPVLVLIAVVGQNGLDILFNVQGAVQHHIQAPESRAGGVLSRDISRLRQDGLQPALGNEHMVSRDGLVIFPPAAEGKGLGGLHRARPDPEGQGKLRPQNRLHPQQLQYPGVGGRLIGALLGQASLLGLAEHPLGLGWVGVADLHMALVKGGLCGHPYEPAQAPLLNQGVLLDLPKLFLGQ